MIRIITLFIVFTALAFICYQIIQFALAISNTKGRMKRDIKRLIASLDTLREELVPLSHEELSLLSVEKVRESHKKGLNPTVTGIMNSIYHEHLIAFAYKEYGNSGRFVLVIMNATDTFSYTVSSDEIAVHLNGNDYGYLIEGRKLISLNNEVLAEIEVDRSISTNRCIIDGKEIAEMINPTKIDGPTNRVYPLLDELDEDKRVNLMIVSLYELIISRL